MSPEEMNDALQRHMSAEQCGDLDEMVATMTADCYRRQPGFGFFIQGRPASRRYYDAWFPAFQSPGQVPPEIGGRAFGINTVVLWMVVTLTMERAFLGIPASHRTARLPMVTIFTFRDSLVESETTHYDTTDMCKQIGIGRQGMKRALSRLAIDDA